MWRRHRFVGVDHDAVDVKRARRRRTGEVGRHRYPSHSVRSVEYAAGEPAIQVDEVAAAGAFHSQRMENAHVDAPLHRAKAVCPTAVQDFEVVIVQPVQKDLASAKIIVTGEIAREGFSGWIQLGLEEDAGIPGSVIGFDVFETRRDREILVAIRRAADFPAWRSVAPVKAVRNRERAEKGRPRLRIGLPAEFEDLRLIGRVEKKETCGLDVDPWPDDVGAVDGNASAFERRRDVVNGRAGVDPAQQSEGPRDMWRGHRGSILAIDCASRHSRSNVGTRGEQTDLWRVVGEGGDLISGVERAPDGNCG